MQNGEWLPEALKRARELHGDGSVPGRPVLIRELGLSDHKARVVADILAGRLPEPKTVPPVDPMALAEAKTTMEKPGDGIYKLAVIGDTHIGSNQVQMSALEKDYDEFERMGVTDVYHGGDLISGVNVFRGQHSELYLHTIEEQVEYTIENYPMRDGIATHFISGNHDNATVKSGGMDPSPLIAAKRPDMEYLGPFSAYVSIGPLVLYLLHPMGSASYSISYKLQKAVEAFDLGRKPNIFAMAHYHQQCYLRARGVHCFMPGSYESQTLFLRRLSLCPQVGGLILTVEIRRGGAEHIITPVFTAHHVHKERDW